MNEDYDYSYESWGDEDLDDALHEKDVDYVAHYLEDRPEENVANIAIIECVDSEILFWLDWLAERKHFPNEYAWSYIYDLECRVVSSQRRNYSVVKQWLLDHNIQGKDLFDWIPQDVDE